METKKNPSADMSRYSLIFFQIGLILMMATTYGLLEIKTYDRVADIPLPEMEVVYTMDKDIPITRVFNTPPPPPPPPDAVAPPDAFEEFEVVEDDEILEETFIESTETNLDEYIKSSDQTGNIAYYSDEVIEDVPFAVIENVPIYPGCENEKDNAARRKCMSEKITALVSRNFNNGLGREYGLEGRQKIYVIFKIDEHGNTIDINSRGPHPALEAEAERVIKLLPQMTPGNQRGKPVRVSYSLPVIFDVKASY